MPEASRIADAEIECAETDMMHRRTLLPYAVPIDLDGVPLLVRSNSAVLHEGVRLLRLPSQLARVPVRAEWQIEVEASGEPCECPGRSSAVELFAFGPSRSLRMANGSWFAWTPPQANGVGFAFVCGNATEQATQLAEYLRTIADFVSEHKGTRKDTACFEGVA